MKNTKNFVVKYQLKHIRDSSLAATDIKYERVINMKLELYKNIILPKPNPENSSKRIKNNVLYITLIWLLHITLLVCCIIVLVSQTRALGAQLWSAGGAGSQRDATVVSCYYNMPTRQQPHPLLPANIHPHLCTHINVAFATIKNNKIYLDEQQYESITDVVLLKKQNPKLKILLSVGGAGNDTGYPAMVADHASRKVFIRSIKSLLKNYSLDGIDLDWEYPAVHEYGSRIKKRERQHFSQLLREIRMEFIRERKNYLLTVAIAAPQIIADVAYDVDQINVYVDYANIMTYDYHSFTEFTPFTGLNSPLYARAPEHLYMATLNINYTVHMYISKGLDKKKIVVGIPTYGHSFALVNANNANVGSPALGYGQLGQLGFVNFPDICEFINTFNFDVNVHYDSDAKVPYLHRHHVWASFDNPQSVMDKAKYIVENDLKGAMIYSLNADDYDGLCEMLSVKKKFPLVVSIKNALNGIRWT